MNQSTLAKECPLSQVHVHNKSGAQLDTKYFAVNHPYNMHTNLNTVNCMQLQNKTGLIASYLMVKEQNYDQRSALKNTPYH